MKNEDLNVSNCCKALLQPVSGEEGTSYWICASCGKPCDPYVKNIFPKSSDFSWGKSGLPKLTKNNKIHKEGFDAGYKKGYKKGMEDKEKELCQNALNKHNPDYLPSWYTQNKDL